MSSSKQSADSAGLPSWDEFNAEGQDEDDFLDYDEEAVAIREPNELEECGPSLPPGFLNDENSKEDGPSSSNAPNDFSIPTENDYDDPEDPQDPQQPRRFASDQRVIGPSLPTAFDKPKAPKPQQHNDDSLSFALPSITSTSDFEPQQRPCSSRRDVIGPSLPPELIASSSSSLPCTSSNQDPVFAMPVHAPDEPQQSPQQTSKRVIGPASFPPEFLPTVAASSPSADRVKSQQIGPSIPSDLLFCDSTRFPDDGFVDEPSSSLSTSRAPDSFPSASHSNHADEDNIVGDPELSKSPNGAFNRRQNGRLKSSENSTNMELPLDDEFIGAQQNSNGRQSPKSDKNASEHAHIGGVNGSSYPGADIGDDDDDSIIGPMLPPANKNAAEEQAEYLSRLVEFESQKAESSSLKREEWMTELPQKMKQSYGLSAKTSFSRSSAGPSSSSQARNAWTATPKNGNAATSSQKDEQKNSASRLEAQLAAQRDKVEEERANAFNENRKESLVDIHQRKRKAAEDNSVSNSSGERRPFNRETDMSVRGFSSGGNLSAEEAKVRLGCLNSRFGPSSSKRFL